MTNIFTSGAHIPFFSNTYLLLIYFFLFTSMNNSPHLPNIVKGRPSTVTLHILYEYIESLEKCREERKVKLQIELEAMLENKFTSLEDKIQ